MINIVIGFVLGYLVAPWAIRFVQEKRSG